MLPTIYRFLIKEYLKVFFLCLVSFITLLVVSQLEDITMLASMGAKKGHILLFTLYQIPYILPIAIPLSCLIASMILFTRLSERGELTALRASGFSIFSILIPLFMITTFLSLANFVIVSEVATTSHLATRKMIFELTSKNPLVLLQNAKITPLKGAYVQFAPGQNGQMAKDLLIAWGNQEDQRLNLAIAKKIKIKDNQLNCKNITLISSQISEDNHHLMIENQNEAKTAAIECAQFLHGGGWKMATDHLRYSLLKVRIKKLKENLKHETDDKLTLQKNLNKCFSEILRRFSFGLAPVSFAFMGSIFGIRIGRTIQKKQVIIASLLAAISLLLFFVAKEFHHIFLISGACLITPHLILFGSAGWQLERLSRGKL